MKKKEVKSFPVKYSEIVKLYRIQKINENGNLVVDAQKTIGAFIQHKDEILNFVKLMTASEKRALLLDLMCVNHTDKMVGMVSINTSCHLNEFCETRRNIAGSICASCYAWDQFDRFPTQAVKNALASIIFQGFKFSKADIPFLNYAFVRFEAFGDLANRVQLENYYLIAKQNKHVHFAMWTKNYGLIVNYCKENKRPKNCIMILSSLYENKPEIKLFNELHNAGYFDKYFTVYSTNEDAESLNKSINCGGNHCAGCLRCYKNNGIAEISELKK